MKVSVLILCLLLIGVAQASSIHAITIGDSISMMPGSYASEFQRNYTPSWVWQAKGIPGEPTTHLLSRWQTDAISQKPYLIILDTGTASGSEPETAIENNIYSMVKSATENNIHIITVNLISIPSIPQSKVDAINSWESSNLTTLGQYSKTFDAHSLLTDSSGSLSPQYWNVQYPDGEHLNESAYLVLSKALYTQYESLFDLPEPDPCILYLPMNGGEGSQIIIDGSPSNHPMSVFGNARLSTAEKRFGTASLWMDGYSTVISPDSSDWYLGDYEKWSIGGWFNTNLPASHQIFISQYGGDPNNIMRLMLLQSGYLYLGIESGGKADIDQRWPYKPEVNVWNYVLVTRDKNIYRAYINGKELTTKTMDIFGSIPQINGELNIGSQGSDYHFAGYLDDWFICKGTAMAGNTPTSEGIPPTPQLTPTITQTQIPTPNPTTQPSISLQDQITKLEERITALEKKVGV